MATADAIPPALQESILTALAYDDRWGAQIAVQLTAQHFDAPYQELASRILEYRRQYGRPPGQAHLDDLVGTQLTDSKRAPPLRRLLVSIVAQSEGLNAEFVASRTQEFVRRQQLKSALVRASERYQQGGDDVVLEVETIMNDALRMRTHDFLAGTRLNDRVRGLSFLDRVNSAMPIGIRELEHVGVGPSSKEMILYIAPKGSGKTWFCIHVGKHGLLQRERVLHITLEVREELVVARYWQALFGAARRYDLIEKTILSIDKDGRLTDWSQRKIKPALAFNDPKIRKLLGDRLTQWSARLGRIIVKEFATSQLTISQLVGFLDYLEMVHRFIPTVLIVDYPDLMNMPKNDIRIHLGRTFQELRGLCVTRNMAGIFPTQGTRASLRARRVRADHVAEDISKVHTADVVLTYSVTDAEKERGLGRLYLAHSRNTEGGLEILLSQSYPTGQFVLQSALLPKDREKYWGKLNASDPEEGG